MKKILLIGSCSILLTGCMLGKPGYFEISKENNINNTVRFRYDPLIVDSIMMNDAAQKYCKDKGHQKATAMPSEMSSIPGLSEVWYKCE